MNMTREFGRKYILSTIDIQGYYKFRDVFQIIAVDDSHPKPSTACGHFPLLIEYSVEIDKEQREQLLDNMCVDGHRVVREMLTDGSCHKSKSEEIMVLLTLFTPSLFFVYNRDMQELSWFCALGSDCQKICWGQKFYYQGEGHAIDLNDFSKPDIKEISRVEASNYYGRLFTYPGQNTAGEGFSLPDIIDTLFEKYYALEAEGQLAFLQASTLFYQSMRIWFKSRSLTYAALISCLETLIHYEYRGVNYDACPQCKTKQYQVMKKFRDFLNVDHLSPEDSTRKYVKKLYDLRSEILHQGYIFAGDLSVPGYYSVTEAEERTLLMKVVSITRRRVLDWLLAQ